MKRYMMLPVLLVFLSFFVALPVYAAPGPGGAPGDERPGGDDRLQFQPPTDCFMRFFSPASTPVGQPSCAKKILRFKVDEVNMGLQQGIMILEAVKNAAKLAGFDMLEGTEIDLTDKMKDESDKKEAEGAARFAEQNISFEVVKALLSRGSDQTIEGALYQVWRFEGAMRTTKGDRSFSDVVDIKVALNEGDPNTTRIIDQNMSFGGGAIVLQGKIVTKSADKAPVSVNLNFEMNNDGGEGMFECADPNDPKSCSNKFSHSFEQTIALAQSFNAEGKDALKINWIESGDGGGGPPPPPEQQFRQEGGAGPQGPPPQGPPPGGSFNNDIRGGSDETGAGCLEMEQDIDAKFRADSRYAGAGGAYCGPFADGSEKCESYKQGRKYSSILKVEDTDDLMFGNCDKGTCEMNGPPPPQDAIEDMPPEFRDQLLAPPQGGGGFACANPSVTNNCDGHCPDGVPPTPPDLQNAANNNPVQAWELGCFEGLMFEDQGISAGFGKSARKAECWDSAGNVSTSSDDYNFTRRDDRIQKDFDRRDNFDDDRAISFERPANFCQMHFDDTRNVEVIDSTGKDFCVPDHFSTNNTAAAGTPLCSAAGPPQC